MGALVQKITRDLIKDLASKYNIPYEKCREIIWSQFEYLKDEIGKFDRENEVTAKNIMLKGLGTFYFNKYNFRRIKRNLNKYNKGNA